MRTTLTLDPDVERLVQEAVHRQRRSRKDVVNDALRRALAPARSGSPFRIRPHQGALRPGLDPYGLNRLSDELESESQLARLHPQ